MHVINSHLNISNIFLAFFWQLTVQSRSRPKPQSMKTRQRCCLENWGKRMTGSRRWCKEARLIRTSLMLMGMALMIEVSLSWWPRQNILISFPFPLLAFTCAYTQTHAYFTTFPTVLNILDSFHPCVSMCCHTLADIRSAHSSVPLPLLFSSTPHHTTPSIPSHTSLTPHTINHSHNLLYRFLVPT